MTNFLQPHARILNFCSISPAKRSLLTLLSLVHTEKHAKIHLTFEVTHFCLMSPAKVTVASRICISLGNCDKLTGNFTVTISENCQKIKKLKELDNLEFASKNKTVFAGVVPVCLRKDFVNQPVSIYTNIYVHKCRNGF